MAVLQVVAVHLVVAVLQGLLGALDPRHLVAVVLFFLVVVVVVIVVVLPVALAARENLVLPVALAALVLQVLQVLQVVRLRLRLCQSQSF